jgi:transposase
MAVLSVQPPPRNLVQGYGLEFLPAYAPELNPVEYLWSHWKQHELPNFCPQTFWQLSHYARKALRRMRRRTTLVTGFWAQAAFSWAACTA